MSPRADILQHVGPHQWALLESGDRRLTLYRWDDGARIELHVIFDPIGRVEAWSEWHNQRIDIDQHDGRRARLFARLRRQP